MSDFSDLMAKDPLLLTKTDIEIVVRGLREQRAKFVLGDKKVGTPQARKSKAQVAREAKPGAAKAVQLDLGDLGIEL